MTNSDLESSSGGASRPASGGSSGGSASGSSGSSGGSRPSSGGSSGGSGGGSSSGGSSGGGSSSGSSGGSRPTSGVSSGGSRDQFVDSSVEFVAAASMDENSKDIRVEQNSNLPSNIVQMRKPLVAVRPLVGRPSARPLVFNINGRPLNIFPFRRQNHQYLVRKGSPNIEIPTKAKV